MRNYYSRLKKLESHKPATEGNQVQILSFRTPENEREKILAEWERSKCKVARIIFVPGMSQ